MIPAAIIIPPADPRMESILSPKSPNRKFSLYAPRMRGDDGPVPAAADASPPPPQQRPQSPMSTPTSPRVQIVPFGQAYNHMREPSDESLARLPPLPLSPRWDSLSSSSKFILQPTASLSSNPTSPLDTPPHPPSPFTYDGYSAPTSRNVSPTLASNSSLADLRAFDTAAVPKAPSPVENFSRPRKLSIRQPITDPAKTRPTPSFSPADEYLELVSSPTQNPLGPPNRPRGPSVSSCQSSSTYLSALSPSPSEFHEPLPPRSRPVANGAIVQRLPLTHNHTGGSASPSAVAAPWMSGEELRSSFRSQFTESTAPGTAVTERSSVLTKDSSVTSLYPPADAEVEGHGQMQPNAPVDEDAEEDDFTLDDLMGMYEKGFDDDSDIEYNHDNDNADERPASPALNLVYDVGPRPDSAASDASFPMPPRPAILTSDRNYSRDSRLPTSTSERSFNRDSRPPTSTSEHNYNRDSRLPTSTSDHHDHNQDSRPPSAVSDMTPHRSSIQIQVDDDDDEDFPLRDGDGDKTSTLDREIRMSKMIFKSPAYIASVPHIAENLAHNSMDKRDSAKSIDSEPSVASQYYAPLSEKAPRTSSPLAERASPISPPTSPPIVETPTSPLPPPLADKPAFTPLSPPISPPPPPQPSPAAAAAAAAAAQAQAVEDPSSRDRYGFKKENQHITRKQYDAWNAGYSEYLARRRKKWIAYLKDNALMTDKPNRFPSPNAKTKRFVRKGIPPDWRGAAWFYYAGGPAILAQHSGLYDKLTVKKPKDVDSEAIERDLHRTFPDNIKFKPPGGFQPQSASARASQSTVSDDSFRRSPVPPPGSEDEPPIITSLRRVLHAFAVYNPRIGYCQSLNFLAGLLLLFVDTEEQCFWLLNVITRIYLPGTHETSLEGSKVDLGVLMTELRDTMPGIWDKVGGDLEAGDQGTRPATGKSIRMTRKRKDMARVSTERLPPITVCMTAWFMSCYIGTLPIETTLRVWDIFFYEGSKTLFRIALAIFKQGEGEIKAVSDPMEMFGVVQGIPRKLIDANGLVEACFKRRNGFGHMSQDTIDVRRQERRARVQLDKIQNTKTNKTWAVTQPEERPKERGLFGKKRIQTSV